MKRSLWYTFPPGVGEEAEDAVGELLLLKLWVLLVGVVLLLLLVLVLPLALVGLLLLEMEWLLLRLTRCLFFLKSDDVFSCERIS